MSARRIQTVLIVNLKSLPTWHLDLAAGFHAVGVRAQCFLTTPQTLGERMEKSVRGTKWFHSPRVLARLVKTCRTLRPELIVFLGQFVLPRATVAAIEAGLDERPLLTAWVCDCFRAPQFDAWTRADHVFYFDTFMQSVLPEFYPDPNACSFLPLAANPARYHPLDGVQQRDALIFVGNVSPNRALVLEAIGDRVALEVYGPNSARNRFNRRRKLDSARINALYNEHAMVLNINQSPNTEYGANLRTFEVPAAGRVLLTQASRDLAQHFVPGEEVLSYASPDELVGHYERMLHDPSRGAAIAAAGLRRARRDHSFEARARTMLAVLQQ